jgi:hypothetical protein
MNKNSDAFSLRFDTDPVLSLSLLSFVGPSYLTVFYNEACQK